MSLQYKERVKVRWDRVILIKQSLTKRRKHKGEISKEEERIEARSCEQRRRE